MVEEQSDNTLKTGIDVPKTLNEMLSICHDCSRFHESATKKVQDKHLSKCMAQMGPVWLETIVVLEPHIKVRNEEPTRTGTVAGTIWQAIAILEAKLGSGEEGEILLEHYLDTENEALQVMRDIAEKDALADPVRSIVQERIEAHETAHAKLKVLAEEML